MVGGGEQIMTISDMIDNMGDTNSESLKDYYFRKGLLLTLARIADALEILAEEKL